MRISCTLQSTAIFENQGNIFDFNEFISIFVADIVPIISLDVLFTGQFFKYNSIHLI